MSNVVFPCSPLCYTLFFTAPAIHDGVRNSKLPPNGRECSCLCYVALPCSSFWKL